MHNIVRRNVIYPEKNDYKIFVCRPKQHYISNVVLKHLVRIIPTASTFSRRVPNPLQTRPRHSLVLIGFTPVVLFAQVGSETRKIVPVGVDTNDNFGLNVAVSGSTVLAGSPLDDDLAPAAGSVYQFDANTGTLVRKILGVDPSTNQVFGSVEDSFGESVALEGNITPLSLTYQNYCNQAM